MGFFILFGIFGFSFLMPYLLTKLFQALKINSKNWLYLLSPIMANVVTVGALLQLQWQREAKLADEDAIRCGMDSLADLFLIFMIFVNVVISLIFQAYLTQNYIPNHQAKMMEKIEQIGQNG